jgi:septal ring factor EnvC (AmiA/AmiB activator)
VSEGNKKGKSSIWMYAVILFTSAFIVLLLTAMSQIRFNKHIDDYKSQIHIKEDEKNRFKSNLTIAIEENTKLDSQVKALSEQIDNLASKLEDSEQMLKEKIDEYKKASEIYKAILLADIEYEKGNYLECAKILYGQVTEPNILDKAIKKKYQFLVDKTYKKAALEFYNKGYRSIPVKKINEL